MSDGNTLPRHWLLRALDLEADREHGSAYLSREAVQAFSDALAESWTPDADAETVRARMEAYAARLRRAQPGVVSVANRLRRCVEALERGREAAMKETASLSAEIETVEQELVRAADRLLRPGVRLVTYSFSQTVLGILTHYADRLECVTTCESRPLNEGVRLTAELATLTLPVRLITEAQMDLFLPECDLALVGADRILPDGDLVNRVGTAVLARLCAAHHLPFYIAADRSKWVSEGDELARFAPERRSPSEVLRDPPRGVEVANVACDRTPAALITGYITETAILEPGAKP